MKRKRRYRKRYKSYKRRYRKRSYTGRGNATEIKYLTLKSQNQASKLSIATADSNSLFAAQNFVANILDSIPIGNTFSNRIGNKIYVMSINVHMLVYGCPSSTAYNVGSFLQRHLWHNQRINANNTINGFFGVDTTINFNSYVDRKSVIVQKDKYFLIRGSDYATASSGASKHCGACREIEYSIPVNRYVTYTQSGAVKEDRDVYSLAVLTASPGMDVNSDLTQIACWQAKFRVYFKDA